MTPDEFRAAGHDLIDWIADYIESVGDQRVQSAVEPGDVRAALPERPPTAPEPFSAVMADVDRVIVPGPHPLAASRLLRLLPVEHVVLVHPRRAALRRRRGAGHELGHVPGLHRARDADARLDDRAARPARPVPLHERARRRRDPGFGERGRPRRHPGRPLAGDRRGGQHRRRHVTARRLRHRRRPIRASRRASASPGSAPTASASCRTTERSRCSPPRSPR